MRQEIFKWDLFQFSGQDSRILEDREPLKHFPDEQIKETMEPAYHQRIRGITLYT